jgi:hypothetical protein
MLEDAIDKVNQIAQEVPAAAPPARQPVDERTLEAELTALAEQLTSGGDAPGSKQVVDSDTGPG